MLSRAENMTEKFALSALAISQRHYIRQSPHWTVRHIR